jgi:hypothetical protein
VTPAGPHPPTADTHLYIGFMTAQLRLASIVFHHPPAKEQAAMDEPHRHTASAVVATTADGKAGAALVPLYVSGVRAELIQCLMRPVGALGLVAVAGGVFAGVRQRHGWAQLQVTIEDAARISADQVLELAAYLQQTTPEIFARVGELVGSQPALAGSLSAVLLLHVLRRARRR